ncbi:phage tail protein [Enterococcus asini]|uniref:Phage tail protein n=1 Tax=Enterococcus asini TaxID=57732 RepID=A0AAW8TSB7_9ENTE|nr:major tail protein [Enterococcus asini]MDT2809193.1 phage tail protein [Enterococcus asini]
MTLVGFKRLTIAVLDTDGKVVADKKWVVEGKANKGATSTAEITGLNKEATKVYGSDIAYYISQKGTGDVSVNLGLLDLEEECNDAILGYEVKNSISYVGENTEPPTVAIMLESKDLDGSTAMLGFFKGKFSRESINLSTLNGDAFEPEAESYVFAAMSDDKEGDSNGQTMGKYIGSETEVINALTAQVFPEAGVTP